MLLHLAGQLTLLSALTVSAPPAMGQSPHYDLSGIWLRDDGQRTSLKQMGSALIAVKLAGGYVPAGSITWQGDYTSSSFVGRGEIGNGKGQTSWVPVKIVVVDQNTIRVTGASFNRTYTREQVPAAPDGHNIRITIYRQYPGDKCTSGYLAVNDRLIVYTLERPWQDNRKNISSIPAGTYPAHLRYDHPDHWRIELQEVPARDNIQIHIGNETDQSKGCILIGTKLGPDLCSMGGGTSRPAYEALKKAFYGAGDPAPDTRITIQIEDAGGKSRLPR